jgi:hypothetical protein
VVARLAQPAVSLRLDEMADLTMPCERISSALAVLG